MRWASSRLAPWIEQRGLAAVALLGGWVALLPGRLFDRPEDGMTVLRVTASPEALALIERLRAKHGELMFHQSGGCCDGSSPMCYPAGELITGDSDVLLGEIGGVPFYMSAQQFEYWQHTQLIIDVVEGRGGMFSLEGPQGWRFLTRSRVFTDEEWAQLESSA